ncbi:MAG: glycosyltransferase family 4 protein [Kiritimatiellae bacterium]|nr:glycosyltransferase family 4 protein [Kiritimatiellia bacterium]
MPLSHKKPTVLALSQVYVPDPASVGQHMADAAAQLVQRGFRVIALTSRRGYENPAKIYPSREVIDGVEVRRLPLSSFGKKSMVLRALAGVLFVIQCIMKGLFVRNLDRILVSTSPPVCLLAALAICFIRHAPIKFWVMDLNPDQLIALGKTKPGSFLAQMFDRFNRLFLRKADKIVVLDRFMADRVNRKTQVTDKMAIIPPWPHEEHLTPLAHEGNPFRACQGLTGKKVIMFSGNLSICSPVTTILQAALRVMDLEKLLFLFIGGGLGRREVEDVMIRLHPRNIQMLPYQPLAEIRYSLSAADIHLVSLGEQMSGIIHPCKIYGAMAVGRPILYLGPADSFIMDILNQYPIGWHVAHGDIDNAERVIREIERLPAEQLSSMGALAFRVVSEKFSKAKLSAQFCEFIAR